MNFVHEYWNVISFPHCRESAQSWRSSFRVFPRFKTKRPSFNGFGKSLPIKILCRWTALASMKEKRLHFLYVHFLQFFVRSLWCCQCFEGLKSFTGWDIFLTWAFFWQKWDFLGFLDISTRHWTSYQ